MQCLYPLQKENPQYNQKSTIEDHHNQKRPIYKDQQQQ